jgi:phage host-nuclease inhibitor protein Gam
LIEAVSNLTADMATMKEEISGQNRIIAQLRKEVKDSKTSNDNFRKDMDIIIQNYDADNVGMEAEIRKLMDKMDEQDAAKELKVEDGPKTKNGLRKNLHHTVHSLFQLNNIGSDLVSFLPESLPCRIIIIDWRN